MSSEKTNQAVVFHLRIHESQHWSYMTDDEGGLTTTSIHLVQWSVQDEISNKKKKILKGKLFLKKSQKHMIIKQKKKKKNVF